MFDNNDLLESRARCRLTPFPVEASITCPPLDQFCLRVSNDQECLLELRHAIVPRIEQALELVGSKERSSNCYAFVRFVSGRDQGLYENMIMSALGTVVPTDKPLLLPEYPIAIQIVGDWEQDVGDMPGYLWESVRGVAHAALVIGECSVTKKAIVLEKPAFDPVQLSYLENSWHFYARQLNNPELRVVPLEEIASERYRYSG